MPLNAPGSLSQANYLAVTAYVMAKNGVPAGQTALTVNDAAAVHLAHLAAAAAKNETGPSPKPSGQADEIVY